MDEGALRIIDAARAGAGINREEIALLLELPPEAAGTVVLNDAARELAMRAAKGHGQVYAQIGVDALLCPENCRFCSFAACNEGGEERGVVAPVEDVVAQARIFADAGCDLISLMATAALPFDALLERVSRVAEVAHGRALVMVNAGDITFDQAFALKRAGADAAYHALRLGEGVITDIQPEQRLQTMANIKEADLLLMSGVEPLSVGVSEEELLDAIFLQRDLRPFCTGVCALTQAAGTLMEGVEAPSHARVRQVASVLRLVCGSSVPFGAGGGIAWVDAGSDPRSRGYGDGADHLMRQVREKRAALAADGWMDARMGHL